jgi:carboxymethylenebutenolidase
MIAAGPNPTDSVRAWLVYPERSTKAPVVVVIHEIFGLSTWVRAVADQLAADGFIAIAPDLLTGKHLPGAPDNVPIDSAVAAIRTLDPAAVSRQVDAAGQYAMKLPAAVPKYGIVGFCWGGSTVFTHASLASGAPGLGAAVAYYGAAQGDRAPLSAIKAPVLAFYGENDERVNATIPVADSALRAAHTTFEHHTFIGAGHGFLRAQDEHAGANLAAAHAAWPQTLAWFRKYLGD